MDEDSKLTETLRNRGQSYGDYVLMCNRIQAIKKAMNLDNSRLAPYQREAFEMIAVKMGRLLVGDPDHRDSWLDLSGYPKLVYDRIAVSPALEKDWHEGQVVKLEPGVTPCHTGGFHYTGQKGWPYKVWLPNVRQANDFAKSLNDSYLPKGWRVLSEGMYRHDATGRQWAGTLESLVHYTKTGQELNKEKSDV